MSPSLYPLITERRIVEPIWGGDHLAAWLDLPAPRPARLGETWQVYDLNPVVNGPLAGRSLADLAREYGVNLLGARSFARYGTGFPLLAKFIDAGDRLSIQVHPDDAYAEAHESSTGFYGKTEAWYILDAAPGADVIYGLSRPSDRDAFAAAAREGALEDLLQRVTVAAGDVLFVPAGTIHAINAGITLFEIQQKSDLTYRVYDYNRRDAKTGQLRELHLEKALAVSDFGPARHGKSLALALAPGRDLLMACPYFALERWHVIADDAAIVAQDSVEILTLIDGACGLTWPDGQIALRRGDSVVLPASLENCTLAGSATLLRVYVPDLESLAAELRAGGHADDLIAAALHPM